MIKRLLQWLRRDKTTAKAAWTLRQRKPKPSKKPRHHPLPTLRRVPNVSRHLSPFGARLLGMIKAKNRVKELKRLVREDRRRARDAAEGT